MKKKIIILVIVALALNFGFKPATAAVDQRTVDYLSQARQSAWITQALRATGQNNLDLSYLESFNPANATDVAKAVLAIVAGGENPYDFQETDFVALLTDYAEEGQIGSPSLLNDDFWGIMALISAGESLQSEVITGARDFILAAQNEDGGWGWAPETGSDPNDTAAAIMALLSAGISKDDQVIQSAVSYLAGSQNEDGGFPFAEGESDAGSDAWVITALNKLDIDPAGWTVGDNNPISHLESLMLEDGSFRWLIDDEEGNLLMTAYAAVALSGQFFPVAYYQPENNQNDEDNNQAEENNDQNNNEEEQNSGYYHLRIEGPEATICDRQIEGTTALDIVENAAELCDFDYNITQTEYGPYLDMIAGYQAEGSDGWQYWINWQAANVGAGDYDLELGDQVLWAFGAWSIQPMSISVSDDNPELEENITATVEYFNGTNWLPVNQAWVVSEGQNYQTNEEGQASLSFDQVGSYEIYAEKENFIRTNRQNIIIGSGVSQSVGLTVVVDNNQVQNNNNEDERTLSFVLDISDLDFGTLRPGQTASQIVRISNNGEVGVYLEGIVQGDSLFEDNLYLDNDNWENYGVSIDSGRNSDLSVRLVIPQNYNSNGQKSADLIFWASSN